MYVFFSGKRFYSRFKIATIVVLSAVFLNACGPRPPRVNQIVAEFNLVPFYADLFSIHPDSVEYEKDRLISRYGSYLEAYSMRVIGTGSPSDEEFASRMGRFLAYEPNKEVLDTCLKVFGDLTGLRKELDLAFRYYLYYFPQADIPDVYLHISGFNQSIVVDSSWVSVSIEKYLGSDCVFYEWLAIPVYLRRGMIPEKVVPDVMKAIAMTRYLNDGPGRDLLSQMVYHGKIQFFMKSVLPYHADELLFDFSEVQLDWCRHYEEMMWASIIERDHLFTNNRLTIQKYVGESPFTSYFGPDSPGRTGVFIGYRIVRSYMKNNPGVTLSELMNTSDYRMILARSSYRP